jgi:hypothetical protein
MSVFFRFEELGAAPASARRKVSSPRLTGGSIDDHGVCIRASDMISTKTVGRDTCSDCNGDQHASQQANQSTLRMNFRFHIFAVKRSRKDRQNPGRREG